LGYALQTRANFFAKTILPSGIHHKEKITPALREAYTGPFQSKHARKPTWVFPRQIRHSKAWLREIESKLPRLASIPTQILWGKQDEPGFRPAEMRRWQSHLKNHETETLEDASHFVQEDRPDRVAAQIRRAIQRSAAAHTP